MELPGGLRELGLIDDPLADPADIADQCSVVHQLHLAGDVLLQLRAELPFLLIRDDVEVALVDAARGACCRGPCRENEDHPTPDTHFVLPVDTYGHHRRTRRIIARHSNECSCFV